uniref:Ig-like domain-containing protein n=1 Tax=Neovison vison TaxID=452646 RepID=A0A8C7EVL4_NEOVI
MRRHWGALLGLLWLQVCRVRGMTVEQSPSHQSLQEGASSTLKCNFSNAANNVQWFRQNPGGGSLTRLFYIASGMKQSGRLNCTVNTKDRSSTLHIGASRLEDSATYLCAVEAQCFLVICSLHPNCSWTCSPHPSLGCAFAPRAGFAHFQTFRFMLGHFFSSPKIRPIRAFISLTCPFSSQKALCR